MYTINIDNLKTYKDKINSEKRSFNSKAYNTFRSSYLNNSGEAIIRKMSSQLSKKYDKIKSGYSNISTWMNDYTSNAMSVEAYLSGSGGGGIQDSGLRNFALSKLIMPAANYARDTIIGGLNLATDYAKTMVGIQSGAAKLVEETAVKTASTVGSLVNSAVENVSSAIGKTAVHISENKETYLKALAMAYPSIALGMKVVKTGAKIANKVTSKVKDVIDVAKNFDYVGFAKEVGHNLLGIGATIGKVIAFPFVSCFKIGYSAGEALLEGAEKEAKYIKEGDIKNALLNPVKTVANTYKRAACTVGTVATSAVEGILTLGENIGDGIGIGVNWVTTGVSSLLGFSTKEERDAKREKYKEEKKNEHFWKDLFDGFYNDTKVGSFLKENAFGFDTSRQVGNMVGEVGGIIAIGAATGGLGFGAAAAGGGAGAAAGGVGAVTASLNTGAMAATAFTSSFGRTTKEAWADGGDYNSGMIAGLKRGAWDAAQWIIGTKMGAFEAKSLTAAQNTAIRIGSDVVTGGAETFADAYIKMGYKDGYTNENGEYVKFDKNDSTFDRYSKLFEEAGGWKGVAQNAIIAGVMSGAGEHFSNAGVKNMDTDSPNMSYKMLEDSGANTGKATSKLKQAMDSVQENADNLKNRFKTKYDEVMEKVSAKGSEPKYKTKINEEGKEVLEIRYKQNGKQVVEEVELTAADKVKAKSLKNKISDSAQDLKAKAKTAKENFDDIKTNAKKKASDSFQNAKNQFDNATAKAKESVSKLKEKVNMKSKEVTNITDDLKIAEDASGSGFSGGSSKYSSMTKDELEATVSDIEKKMKDVDSKISKISNDASTWQETYDQMGEYIELGKELDEAKKALRNVETETKATGIKDSLKDAKDKVKASADNISDSIDNKVNSIKQKAKDSYENIKEKVNMKSKESTNISDDFKIVEDASGSGIAAERNINDVIYDAKSSLDEGVEKIKNQFDNAKSKVDDSVNKLKNNVENLKAKVEDSIENIKQKKNLKSKVQEKIDESLNISKAKEKISDDLKNPSNIDNNVKNNFDTNNTKPKSESNNSNQSVISPSEKEYAEKVNELGKIMHEKGYTDEEISTALSGKTISDLDNAIKNSTDIPTKEERQIINNIKKTLKEKEFSDDEISKFVSKLDRDNLSVKAKEVDNMLSKSQLKYNKTFDKLSNIMKEKGYTDDEIMKYIGKKNQSQLDYIIENSDRIKDKSINRFSAEQQDMIEFMNDMSDKSSPVYLTSTKEVTSDMLSEIENIDNLSFYLDTSYTDANGKFKTKYSKTRYTDRATYTGREMKQILGKIEELETKIDMTLPPKERARQIYDIIADEYDYVFDYGSNHNVVASLRGITDYNALGKEGLVCAGYSSLYKELCERSGIKCDYIHGIGGSPGGRQEMHAWNVVILDDEIIPVDVTWHSGSNEYDWFGKSDRFNESHFADSDELYRVYN